MNRLMKPLAYSLFLCALLTLPSAEVYGQAPGFKGNIYPVGKLKPRDSVLAVKVGDNAYLISTKYLWDKPQVSDAQLQEVAKTIVDRLQ